MQKVSEFSIASNEAGETLVQVSMPGAARGLPREPVVVADGASLVLCRTRQDKFLLGRVSPDDLAAVLSNRTVVVVETYGAGGTAEIEYEAGVSR